jgi:cytochrome b561
MQIKNSNERYGAAAQLLHWSIVILIITQVVLAKQAEIAEEAHHLLQQAKILTTHKSVGMTIFMLAIARIVWRFTNGAPDATPNTKPWQHRLASVMHWALYALILLTPLAGWLMSSAKNYSVSWFGFFTFPNLVGPSETQFDQFKELHETLAQSMIILAILHAIAALKHHLFDKDNVLRRMLPMKLK